VTERARGNRFQLSHAELLSLSHHRLSRRML
jgi:hypothetical protein